MVVLMVNYVIQYNHTDTKLQPISGQDPTPLRSRANPNIPSTLHTGIPSIGNFASDTFLLAYPSHQQLK